MRKIIYFILILVLLIKPVLASTDTAYSYTLMDMNTGRVILSKNQDKPMLIASITKIMTAIIAIENKNLDETVTVTDIVKKSYGSGVYITSGEEISLRDLLYGLMLRSGNDAALMISEYVGGSEEEFVKLMNNKAKEIGMKNTKFNNSSGLDNDNNGNLSTTYDMALLTKYAMQSEEYKMIVATKKRTVKTNLKTYVWHNKNKLLSEDYITGGKTGYTEKAKRTLVSTSSKDDMNLVVVTIKDSDDWNTHKSLHNYAFNNYDSYKVVNKKTFKVFEDNCYSSLYIKNDVYLTIKESEGERLTSHIKLECNKNYKDGDKVGDNYIYLDNILMHVEPIYAKKSKSSKKVKWFK